MDRWLKRTTVPEVSPAKRKGPTPESDPTASASNCASDAVENSSETASVTVQGKRKDKFQANWLKIYPWLQFNGDEMSCSLCKTHGYIFISKCFKTSTLIRHSNSSSPVLELTPLHALRYITKLLFAVTSNVTLYIFPFSNGPIVILRALPKLLLLRDPSEKSPPAAPWHTCLSFHKRLCCFK